MKLLSLFKAKPPATSQGVTLAASPNSLFNDIAVYPEVFGTLFRTVFDPDDTLKKAGLRRSDLKRLQKDPEVWQCICKRLNALTATPWRLEPYKSRNEKWLWLTLEPHMEALFNATINAVLYGYAVLEVVYQKGDRIGIQSITEKPFQWFIPTHTGELYWLDPQSGQETLCDPRKFILIRSRASYENPYGEALMSRLWWDVLRKFECWKNWSLFIERFAQPLMLGKTDGDLNEFSTRLAAAVRGAAIATTTLDTVEAVNSSNTGESFVKMHGEINATIQKLILGQTLTSEVGKSGSFAAAKVHADVQEEQRNADIRLAIKAAQSLVNTLAQLNGFEAPAFNMGDDTGLEMERAQRDALLVEKGVLKLTEDYLLTRYDYEPGDFEMVDAVKQDQNTPLTQQTNNFSAGFRLNAIKGPVFTPEQQAVEALADQTLAALGSPIKAELIASAIRAAKSPEDLEQRLALILSEADVSEFSRVLEKSLFACDVMGYAHSDQ